MPKYIQYYKLQKYVEGQPVQEFKKGEVVKEDWWPTMGSCEQNDQPTWEIVNNEFICEKDNASNLWNQYQKLQKYVGGQPYLPEEFMKGEIVQSGVEYSSLTECETPGAYWWEPIADKYVCEEDAEGEKTIINYTLADGISDSTTALKICNRLDTSEKKIITYGQLKGKNSYTVPTNYTLFSDGDVFKKFELIAGSTYNSNGYGHINYWFDNSKYIEECTLYINENNLDHSFYNCPNLTTLKLNWCYKGSMRYSIYNCPKLRTVELSNYIGITTSFVDKLLTDCPSLKQIKCTTPFKDIILINNSELVNNHNIEWIITD